jgi:Arc/MetJ-type ribon-helix-helix transcriptional regulator
MRQNTLTSNQNKPVNLGRHQSGCKICSHPRREEIEREFIAWKSPTAIVKQYGLADRTSIYRHAHALGLFAKRSRNVRAALEQIIERAGDVEVNAAAVVQAVATYARINAEGRLVDRSERVNLNELFDRMSREELETYAKDGRLPGWFTATVGATSSDSQEK